MTTTFLVIHGPNLNALGKRETDVYGNNTLDDINETISTFASKNNLELTFFQSNHEGEIVDTIHNIGSTVDGIIINPAAFTHTSVAIRDAIASTDTPTIEVHLSNIYSREEFRHHSYCAPVCLGQVSGLGINSYLAAIQGLLLHLTSH
ncbi:type II 3-dehydroquinate dehydratase [Candidatus Marinamargulisbacteria bacterium SCGC AG-343-D04]|nr:type II 3-dehydroquinate dehydratase [Candidatus Marinamargulisbacteria bacterium SCGC AG-343-D04]